MFEQAFRNIDDILRREMSSELDYVEQTSWLLFLKYLDALEHERAQQAELDGRTYTFLLEKKFRWDVWLSRGMRKVNWTTGVRSSAAISASSSIRSYFRT